MNTRTTAKQKTTRTTAKKADPPVKTEAENAVILKDLRLGIAHSRTERGSNRCELLSP